MAIEQDERAEERRQERALQEAEAKGRAAQKVDSRLEGHDRKLAAINGQLERGAKATELLGERILRLDDKVNTLTGELSTKREVDKALRKSAEESIKQQITRREFWIGIAIVACTITGAAIQLGHVL